MYVLATLARVQHCNEKLQKEVPVKEVKQQQNKIDSEVEKLRNKIGANKQSMAVEGYN
jgi:hypothetical protein